MKLRPSMRSNKRYVLAQIQNKEDIKKAVVDYLGVLGLAKMNLISVKKEGDKILFALDRTEVDNLRAAIECSNFDIKILRVSGTIKGI